MDFINVIDFSACISLVLSAVTVVVIGNSIFIGDLDSIPGRYSWYKDFIARVKVNWDDYLSLFITIWFLLFLAFTLILTFVFNFNKPSEDLKLKQELIKIHEKEKCPECIYILPQPYYKWSKETNRREKVKIDFRWLKCPKLEAELKEKLKRD